mmetsp:Transcript_47225/g.140963  ORF Transcript_47225/g.140963 Transcript_47225/m.140963 type:complete len:392 (-) Transcript_47225:59-1234(-)
MDLRTCPTLPRSRSCRQAFLPAPAVLDAGSRRGSAPTVSRSGPRCRRGGARGGTFRRLSRRSAAPLPCALLAVTRWRAPSAAEVAPPPAAERSRGPVADSPRAVWRRCTASRTWRWPPPAAGAVAAQRAGRGRRNHSPTPCDHVGAGRSPLPCAGTRCRRPRLPSQHCAGCSRAGSAARSPPRSSAPPLGPSSSADHLRTWMPSGASERRSGGTPLRPPPRPLRPACSSRSSAGAALAGISGSIALTGSAESAPTAGGRCGRGAVVGHPRRAARRPAQPRSCAHDGRSETSALAPSRLLRARPARSAVAASPSSPRGSRRAGGRRQACPAASARSQVPRGPAHAALCAPGRGRGAPRPSYRAREQARGRHRAQRPGLPVTRALPPRSPPRR